MKVAVVDNGGQWTHREYRVLRDLDQEERRDHRDPERDRPRRRHGLPPGATVSRRIESGSWSTGVVVIEFEEGT